LKTVQERMDPKPIVALLLLSACANGVPSLKKDFELDAGAEIIAMGDKGGLNDEADLEHHLPGPRRPKPAPLTPTGDSPRASYYKLSEEPPGDWAGFDDNSGTAGAVDEWSSARNKRQVAMMLIKRRSTSEKPVVRQNAIREGSRGRPKLVRQNAVDHS